jgi:hypothetical protein
MRKFRAEQREQGTEGFRDTAVRGGGEQDQVPRLFARKVFQQFVALVLVAVDAGGGRRAVGFVDDDEVRAMLEEVVALAVALHEVDADDLNGVVAEDAARPGGNPALELADGASMVLPTPTSSAINIRMGSNRRAMSNGTNWYVRGRIETRPRERSGVAPSRRVRRAACQSRWAPATFEISSGDGGGNLAERTRSSGNE